MVFEKINTKNTIHGAKIKYASQVATLELAIELIERPRRWFDYQRFQKNVLKSS